MTVNDCPRIEAIVFKVFRDGFVEFLGFEVLVNQNNSGSILYTIAIVVVFPSQCCSGTFNIRYFKVQGYRTSFDSCEIDATAAQIFYWYVILDTTRRNHIYLVVGLRLKSSEGKWVRVGHNKRIIYR